MCLLSVNLGRSEEFPTSNSTHPLKVYGFNFIKARLAAKNLISASSFGFTVETHQDDYGNITNLQIKLGNVEGNVMFLW